MSASGGSRRWLTVNMQRACIDPQAAPPEVSICTYLLQAHDALPYGLATGRSPFIISPREHKVVSQALSGASP